MTTHLADRLGTSYVGPDQWREHQPHLWHGACLPSVPDFPWPEELLDEACPLTGTGTVQMTHFAFLGLPTAHGQPVSIARLVSSARWRFAATAEADVVRQPYATEETCALRWHLVSRVHLPRFAGMPYAEQVAALPPDYEVATAVELATAAAFNLHVSPRAVVRSRTEDPAWPGTHVAFVSGRKRLLSLANVADAGRSEHVTLLASRKPGR